MIGYFENLLQDTKNFAEKQVFVPLKAKINIGKYLHFSHFFVHLNYRFATIISIHINYYFYYFHKFVSIVQQHCTIVF